MSTTSRLEQTILSGGSIRSPYYFNGRLLSAEDLSAEHAATVARERGIARAIGSGVSYGLDVRLDESVSPPAAQVTVSRGLAINRCGETVELCDDATLLLEKPSGALLSRRDSAFTPCLPVPPGGGPSRAGAYVLTLFPSEKREGRAPVAGLGNEIATCNARQIANGVQFRLVEIPTTGIPSDSFLRNRLALRCLGLTEVPIFNHLMNPVAYPPTDYGLFGTLGAGRLVDSEVPIALVYWSAPGSLEFIDRWAVRRRVTRPSAGSGWTYYTDDRRQAEAEAQFQQFQEHLEDVRINAADPATVRAADFLEVLPPVGFLAAGGTMTPAGFDPRIFFGAATTGDIAMLDALDVRSLVQESFGHEPVSLSSGARLQLYVTRESFEASASNPDLPATVVYASPSLTYRGKARFDVARFNHAYFHPHIL